MVREGNMRKAVCWLVGLSMGMTVVVTMTNGFPHPKSPEDSDAKILVGTWRIIKIDGDDFSPEVLYEFTSAGKKITRDRDASLSEPYGMTRGVLWHDDTRRGRREYYTIIELTCDSLKLATADKKTLELRRVKKP